MSKIAVTKSASLACRVQQLILLMALTCIINGVWVAYQMEMTSAAVLLAGLAVLPALHLLGFVETFSAIKTNSAAISAKADIDVRSNADATLASSSVDSELWYDLPIRYKDVSLLSRHRPAEYPVALAEQASAGVSGQPRNLARDVSCHVH